MIVKHQDNKKFHITPELLEEIKALIMAGETQRSICEYYDIGYDTWVRRKAQYPELDQIVRQGKMKTKAFVSGILLELIREKNLTAIMFYLKTQGGWKEAKDEEPQQENKPDEKLVITTTDPIEGAKIYQQFMLNT